MRLSDKLVVAALLLLPPADTIITDSMYAPEFLSGDATDRLTRYVDVQEVVS